MLISPSLPPLGGFWPNAPRSGVRARAQVEQVELAPTASPQGGRGGELSHNFRARALAQRRARAIRGGIKRECRDHKMKVVGCVLCEIVAENVCNA